MLREIVKFGTYIDSLTAANTLRSKVYTEREAGKSLTVGVEPSELVARVAGEGTPANGNQGGPGSRGGRASALSGTSGTGSGGSRAEDRGVVDRDVSPMTRVSTSAAGGSDGGAGVGSGVLNALTPKKRVGRARATSSVSSRSRGFWNDGGGVPVIAVE